MKNTVWVELEDSSCHSATYQVTDEAVKILNINNNNILQSTFDNSNNLFLQIKDVTAGRLEITVSSETISK